MSVLLPQSFAMGPGGLLLSPGMHRDVAFLSHWGAAKNKARGLGPTATDVWISETSLGALPVSWSTSGPPQQARIHPCRLSPIVGSHTTRTHSSAASLDPSSWLWLYRRGRKHLTPDCSFTREGEVGVGTHYPGTSVCCSGEDRPGASALGVAPQSWEKGDKISVMCEE